MRFGFAFTFFSLTAPWTATCDPFSSSTGHTVAKHDAGAASQHPVAPVDRSEAHAVPDAAPTATAAAFDPKNYDGPWIGAMFMETPVMSDMEWPKKERGRPRKLDPKDAADRVMRIGYIRHGSKAPVFPEVHNKPNCGEGWYELVSGGFVCGKYATLELNHPRVRLSPHPPDMDAALPYQYGYNLRNGTPLYRSIPSGADRIKYEPWLRPAKKSKARPVVAASDANTTALSGDSDFDAGLPVSPAVVTIAPNSLATGGTGRAATAELAGPGGDTSADDETPWYLRNYDGGKPAITLDELREDGGPIVRRMIRGFYLALDKEFTATNGTKWWKTTSGLAAPHDRIYVQNPLTDFHGVWLSADLPTNSGASPSGPKPITHLPVGFMLSIRGRKYALNAERTRVTAQESVGRFTTVGLTGKTATIGRETYDETLEGWWMRRRETTRAVAAPPPTDLAPGEKWIDINLTNQTVIAFEGTREVYATLASTGRRNPNVKSKDHPTPTGSFRIREKHIAAIMDGDGSADGPYSIEDVPWIMYFSGDYALHGAFWHADFGRTRSHGCVNLAPADAHALFGWSDPPMPVGWHGVWATSGRPGTRVVVHN